MLATRSGLSGVLLLAAREFLGVELNLGIKMEK
jgi:hypothetical protein